MNMIKSEFISRLEKILPSGECRAYFSFKNRHAYRINTLKNSVSDLHKQLEDRGVVFERVGWCETALMLTESLNPEQQKWLQDQVDQGRIYRQSLSSMLAAEILDPHPGEKILDLCAAPGSKTTQMAAMMGNEGVIWAVEAIRGRYYKLRSVAQILGAANIRFLCADGRRFRLPGEMNGALFDKVLVDAPCSAESRFHMDDPESYAYWSPRKIKEMVRKQRGLVMAGLRCLKPGGELVYSTCTFAPEENEGVVDWALRKSGDAVVIDPPVAKDKIQRYPCLEEWDKKKFNRQVEGCWRVLPTKDMEGFFIARFRKNK